MEWKVLVVTFNANMQRTSETAVEALLANALRHKPHIVAVGMQEVAISESIGGGGGAGSWQKAIALWMAAQTGMVLVARTYMATNTLSIFIRRNMLGMVRRIDFRYSKDKFGGLSGHKGSIGARLQLNGIHSLVFINSHFIHGVENSANRIAQFLSGQDCSFPEDSSVLAIFWLGDLNSRMEGVTAEEMETLIEKRAAYAKLDTNDQLKLSQSKGLAFVDYVEPNIAFRPTYKLVIGSTVYDLKRTPSWCDRILFKSGHVTALSYDSNSAVLSSDHLPVEGIFLTKMCTEPLVRWDCVFEHIPTWYSTVPLIARFNLRNNFWRERGSIWDWVGLFNVSIDDINSPLKWVYVIACQSQTVQDHFYYVVEFSGVSPGNYRLGYFSAKSRVLIGISPTIEIVETPLSEAE